MFSTSGSVQDIGGGRGGRRYYEDIGDTMSTSGRGGRGCSVHRGECSIDRLGTFDLSVFCDCDILPE